MLPQVSFKYPWMTVRKLPGYARAQTAPWSVLVNIDDSVFVVNILACVITELYRELV